MINSYYLIKLNRHRDNIFGLNVMDTLTMRLTSLAGNLEIKMMLIQDKLINNGNSDFFKWTQKDNLTRLNSFMLVTSLGEPMNLRLVITVVSAFV